MKVDEYARENGLLNLTAIKKDAAGRKIEITKDVSLHYDVDAFSRHRLLGDMLEVNDAKRDLGK